MCSVSSAQGTSTCDARSGYEEYVRFAAKDSDSDSDIEGDAGCTVHTGESIEDAQDAQDARDAQDAEKDAPPACASTVQYVQPHWNDGNVIRMTRSSAQASLPRSLLLRETDKTL